MELEVLTLRKVYNNQGLTPKATLYKSGVLVFNKESIVSFNLKKGMLFNIGKEKANISDCDIYLIPTRVPKNASKIKNFGSHLSIYEARAFRNLVKEYKNEKVVFDLIKKEHNGSEVFVLIKNQSTTTMPTN